MHSSGGCGGVYGCVAGWGEWGLTIHNLVMGKKFPLTHLLMRYPKSLILLTAVHLTSLMFAV